MLYFDLKYKCQKILLLEKHLEKMLKNPNYYFDDEKANQPIKFIEKNIKHWKSPYSGPLILEQWQKTIIQTIFGFYHLDKDGKQTDKRVIRECFFFCPRKNGKTAIFAALLLYILCLEGEGLEIYIGASKREQAHFAFTDCKAYISHSPILSKHLKTWYNKIDFLAKKSTIKPLAWQNNKGSGAGCQAVLLDEIHEHPDNGLIDIMRTSQASRHNPLIFMTTTAGGSKFGPCWTQYDYSSKILNGIIKDDTYLPVLFECDYNDDLFSDTAFLKANPSLGISVQYDYILRELKKSKDQKSYAPKYQRLHLNRWVSTKENKWLNLTQIESCYKNYNFEQEFDGKDVYCGLDLASKRDLTSLCLTHIHDGKTYIKHYYWLPEETKNELILEHKIPYDEWENDGYLETTPGDVLDVRYISARIMDILSKYNVKHLCYDPAFAYDISPQLVEEDINCSEFKQSLKNYNYSCLELENYLVEKKICQDGNPITIWNLTNAKLYISYDGLRKPVKDYRDYKERIDGVCALLFAIEAKKRDEIDEKGNNTRGLESIKLDQVDDIKKIFLGI
jgi:phage terminase large subunit-like protein